VSTAAAAFAKDLARALGILGLVLTLATSVVQVLLGLRPLSVLRRGIADIRLGRSRRLPEMVPAEVGPLVEEVNALLETQEGEIERARGRAADLAHGLKTPLAALIADAGRLRDRGEQAIALDIETVASAMGRHVDRELTRARLRGAHPRRSAAFTAVAPLVRSLVATLARTPDGSRVEFEQRIGDDLTLPRSSAICSRTRRDTPRRGFALSYR
jgi:signal transduction histidine kinase